MDATGQGLSEGIDWLTKAIQLGYADPAAAHRLLRDAYGEMRAFLKESDPEWTRYDALQKREVALIVKLDPSDLANSLDFILHMGKPGQMAALSEFVANHPEFAPGQYALSRLLFDISAYDEALPHAERWVAEAKGTEARDGGVTLLESVSTADLRRIVSSAPNFHPAQYALALRLLHEGARQ